MLRKLGVVAALWRYPVKGMQGESVEKTEIDRNGVVGDRVHVLRELTPNRIPAANGNTPSEAVLGAAEAIQLQAKYLQEPREGGMHTILITLPNGASLAYGDIGMDIFISSALNRRVGLIAVPQMAIARAKSGRALHLLTTASLRKLREYYPAGDFDLRRFRPNIVVDTPDGQAGFVEEDWQGQTLFVGQEIQIRVEEPNRRCVVPTLQQGNLPFDANILRTIAMKNKNNLGVVCSVIKGGLARVGDELHSIT